MSTRNLAMTAAGVVAVTACSMASVTAWLLVTSPAKVALAVQGGDAQPLAELALHALYAALAHLARYMTDQRGHARDAGGMTIGLLIMLIGVGLLLDRVGVVDALDYVTFWPVVLITLGLVKLSHRRPDGRREGGWWVVFGTWLLLNQLHVLRLREYWPLVLVAIGISMVWKETRTRARVE